MSLLKQPTCDPKIPRGLVFKDIFITANTDHLKLNTDNPPSYTENSHESPISKKSIPLVTRIYEGKTQFHNNHSSPPCNYKDFVKLQ